MGYPFYFWPNYLMMNQGDETFINQATELGIEPTPARAKPCPRISTGAWRSAVRVVPWPPISAASASWTSSPTTSTISRTTSRTSCRARTTSLSVPRTRSNRDAVGAVVRLYQGNKIMTRQVQAVGGSNTGTSHTLHFGLGDQPTIDRIEITWPRGLVQTLGLDTVKANQLNDIVEPGPTSDGGHAPK